AGALRPHRASRRSDPGGGEDTGEEMGAEQRLGIALGGVSHGSIPGAAAFEVVAPDNRMIGAHRASLIARLIERREEVDHAARIAAEIVPLIRAQPGRGQIAGRGMLGIGNPYPARLDRRMTGEIGADEPAIPWPVVFRVARGMNAHEAAAAADIALEGGFLSGIEDVAR